MTGSVSFGRPVRFGVCPSSCPFPGATVSGVTGRGGNARHGSAMRLMLSNEGGWSCAVCGIGDCCIGKSCAEDGA